MIWYETFLHQAADRLLAMDVSLAAYPIVFAGGLLTNFCPCNVALVPMIIGYVGGFSRTRKRRKALLYSAAFSAGIVITFCLLGVTASALGSLIAPFRAICLWLLAVAAGVMGGYCLGMLRFRLPGIDRDHLEGRMARGGAWAAFILGLLAGVVAAPCTTPVLTVILLYVAVQARLAYGITLLLTYSAGFVVPLLLAGAFAGFLLKMQRIQERTGYQQWIKRACGAGLVLFSIYLAWQALTH
jgi:cytochrome c-type biogenesis protein